MNRFTRVGFSSLSGRSGRAGGAFGFCFDSGLNGPLNGPLKGPVRIPRVAVALCAPKKKDVHRSSGNAGVIFK